jgi:hypothetical protein
MVNEGSQRFFIHFLYTKRRLAKIITKHIFIQ